MLKPGEFLERFRQSPLGRQVESQAQMLEGQANQRLGWLKELTALREEMGERVPALYKAAAEAREVGIRVTLEAHAAATKAELEAMDFSSRTGRRVEELDRLLRDSSDSRLSANGALAHLLGATVGHLVTQHLPYNLPRIRERIRDYADYSTPGIVKERQGLQAQLDSFPVAEKAKTAAQAALTRLAELELDGSFAAVEEAEKMLATASRSCPICGAGYLGR